MGLELFFQPLLLKSYHINAHVLCKVEQEVAEIEDDYSFV